MGLLDAFNTEEGRFGLGLLAAAGPRADGAGFGQRLNEAMGSLDSWKQQQRAAKVQAMQFEQQQQQAEREKLIRALAPNFVRQARPAFEGDPVTGLQPMPAQPAGFDYEGYANALAGVDPMTALAVQQATRKSSPAIKVGHGETLITPDGKVIYAGAAKDEKDSKIKQYEYYRANGGQKSFEEFITLAPTIIAGAQAPLRAAQIENIQLENAYNLPATARAKSAPVSVTAGGKIYTFPDQKSANNFKMKAGIK